MDLISLNNALRYRTFLNNKTIACASALSRQNDPNAYKPELVMQLMDVLTDEMRDITEAISHAKQLLRCRDNSIDIDAIQATAKNLRLQAAGLENLLKHQPEEPVADKAKSMLDRVTHDIDALSVKLEQAYERCYLTYTPLFSTTNSLEDMLIIVKTMQTK